jgi:23S rRNA (pseudouridine1915-N3)-methyltransferase
MVSFPKLKLVVVGKIKKRWIQEGIEVYFKRLPELEITEIKDSDPIKEGEQVLSSLKSDQRLIILTEEGKLYPSVDFANFLTKADSNGLLFFIGSAEGISSQLKMKADLKLSLSPMTFPHEMARLLLVEQLYRAKTIMQGSQYHK